MSTTKAEPVASGSSCSSASPMLAKNEEAGEKVELSRDSEGQLATFLLLNQNSKVLSLPRPRFSGRFAGRTSFGERVELMEEEVNIGAPQGRLFKSTLVKGERAGRPVTTSDFVLFHLTTYFATVTNNDGEKKEKPNGQKNDSNHKCARTSSSSSYNLPHFATAEPFDTTYICVKEQGDFKRTRVFRRPLCRRPGHLLLGYAHALLSMVTGEVAEFAIHNSLAYGPLGSPPRIPPRADLIVILEVVEVHPPGSLEYFYSAEKVEDEDENEDLEEEEIHFTAEQILAFAGQDRALGNGEYRAGRYSSAHHHYRRTMEMLERRSWTFVDSEEIEELVKGLLLLLYTSAGACALLMTGGEPSRRAPLVINYARRALRIDPFSAKANFQMAKGYLAMDNLYRAAIYILKAQHLRPLDRDIAVEARKILTLQAELKMKRTSRDDLPLEKDEEEVEEEEMSGGDGRYSDLMFCEGRGGDIFKEEHLKDAIRIEAFKEAEAAATSAPLKKDFSTTLPTEDEQEKIEDRLPSPWSIRDMLESLDSGDEIGARWDIDITAGQAGGA